ncbi:hypothetical protein [Shewanella pneumatophori]|uniref:Uncharacterized protein n=1 Tax=Shewanella pneumatophori TaxID=314092 RepID=A0A9X1ZEL0_9GAMM|nr:hypothetical protein [Shewanella pneumatophori]MCL1140904.1 hypothetical protein [Shewanella pneumatophori]
MSWAHIRSGAWLKGSIRLWLFDLGCVSFLGVALLGLVMVLGLPLILPADAQRKVDTLVLLMNMSIGSICIAIGWQMNRLAATEWACIVPQYRLNVMLQAAALLLLMLSVVCGFFIAYDAFDKITESLISLLLGLSFLYFSLARKNAFHFSFFLYISLPMLPYIEQILPQGANIVLVLLNLALMLLVSKKMLGLTWNNKARSVYLNGLEMGWIWLPSPRSMALLNRIERSLHPANYFIGPVFSMLLLLMPLTTLLLAGIGHYYAVEIPVLVFLVQFNCILCGMLHWSRIQRWRAVESLFVLPGFDGKQGMINAFMQAQYRLLAILVVSMMITASIVSLLDQSINLSVWLHMVLTTLFACAATLGLGSMCRNSIQISGLIFLIGLLSGWSSVGMSSAEQTQVWDLVAWDLLFLLLSIASLWRAKQCLWREDLLSR